MFHNLLKYSLVLVFLFIDVYTQVCNDYKFITRMAQETYKVSYRITYVGQCFTGGAIYWCPLTRWKTEVKRRFVPVSGSVSMRKCCDGYRRDENSLEHSNITCKPICEPSCENGYCKYPGNCECYDGYTRDEQNNHTCVQIDQTQTTAESNSNFESSRWESGTTETNPTFVSSRWESETTPDYDSIRNCDIQPCGNGTCVSPKQCRCFDGYEVDFFRLWGYYDGSICVPICTDCSGSDCVAPNKCVGEEVTSEMNPATELNSAIESSRWVTGTNETNPFFLSSQWESERNISNPIIGISRFESGTNVTNTTFVSSRQESETTPDYDTIRNCDIQPCGNGTCVSPKQCRCFDGYEVDFFRLWGYYYGSICVPICIDCSGSDCVAPNKCVGEEVTSEMNSATELNSAIESSRWESGTNETNPIFASSQWESERNESNPIIGSSRWESGTNETNPIFVSSKWESERNESNPATGSSRWEPVTVPDYGTMKNCDINPCGNGTCMSPKQCRCFDGYEVDYSTLWGYHNGPVCVPTCTDCSGSDCVAPNKCAGEEDHHQDLCDDFRNCNKTINTNKTAPALIANNITVTKSINYPSTQTESTENSW